MKRLEKAVLEYLGGTSATVVAKPPGMDRTDLIEAADAYQKAGHRALAALLARRAQKKGRDR